MRRRYPSFAEACDRALARAAGTLEQIAYERAVEGWDVPIVHAGRIVGQRRRHAESLLRLLLQREDRRKSGAAHVAQVIAADQAALVAMADETNASIPHKLAVIDRRRKQDERERLLAWADEMVRRELAP